MVYTIYKAYQIYPALQPDLYFEWPGRGLLYALMRIAHLADIHIQDRRRPEYAAVFARLYESLRREAPDLIVVAGDVFDNKMRASPHNLEDVAALLTTAASIAPVVLIAGNHDTNCLAPGSLDLLTPLVADREALRPPRLTYWRRSGVYEAHGCIWTVIATDGERPPAAAELAAREAAAGAPHICLFHEEVNGALLPNGTQMRDFALTTASFGQYDLALGGHIHLRQRFAARAAYCGSLVQQNIGESHLGHGYVLWEFTAAAGHAPYRTEPPRMRGIDIPNDHGFVRVELDAAGCDITPRPLPGRPLYWELLHDEDAPPTLVAEQAAAYAAAYGMPARAVRPRPRRGAPPEAATAAASTTDEARERAELASAQTASRTLEAHERIIRELLAGDENVDAVLALHRERWAEPASQAAGGKIRLVRLEFDNLYAFGPGNVVDFTALEGCVSGVIAPNHTGKSSLIEALVFALYEEHPRAPAKKDVIRRGAGSCRLTLDFELDGRPGRIVKGMFSGGTQNSTASQYRFEYAGENRTRGGTLETLAEIESVLGGAVNALASSFQLQGHEAASGGFIEATPSGRKKLIASVMALGSFEGVERATAKELTECGGEVKALAGQFRGETVAALEGQLARVEERLTEVARSAGAAASAAAPDEATAEAALAALARQLGDLSPEELTGGFSTQAAAAPSSAASSSADPATRPEIAAAELAAELAAAAAAAQKIAIGEITPAQRSLASRWDPELLSRAESIVASGGPSPAAPAMPAAPPPAGPRPGGKPYPGLGERRGARPQPEELAAAAAEHSAGRAYDERAAARWNPEEHRDLVQVLERLSGAESKEATMAALACARLSCGAAQERLAVAAANLAGLPTEGGSVGGDDSGDDSGASGGASGGDTEDACSALRSAQAWVAAVAHAGTIRAQLRPSAGCEGCRHALHILGGESEGDIIRAQAAYRRALEAARRQAAQAEQAARAELASTTAAVATAEAACRQSAALETAQSRLAAAETARLHHETRSQQAAAVAVLEAENYWAAQAVGQWELHAAEAAHAEASAACRALVTQRVAEAAAVVEEQHRAQEQHMRVSAADRAVETLELANAWAAADYDAWQRYGANQEAWVSTTRDSRAQAAETLDSALACARAAEDAAARSEQARLRHAAAAQRLEAARAAAACTLAAAGRAAAARSRGLAARAWWKNALRGCAAAAAARATAASLSAAAEARAAKAAVAAATAETAARAEVAAATAAQAVSQEATALQREAGRLQAELTRESARASQHGEAATRQAVLKAYRAVLRPSGGIGDRLLERGRAALSRQINGALRELGAHFAAEICADYGVTIWPTAPAGAPAGTPAAPAGAPLPASLGSGYQKFVLGLAARLATWRLSASPRPDAFIVDEGFGACDEEYLEAMATALESLAAAPGGPRLVFVVSHVDALKARLGRALEIEAGPAGSRVANARAAATRALPAPEHPPGLNPDPDKAGNVVCEVCRQSLQASRATAHLASAKHTAAVAKAARAKCR